MKLKVIFAIPELDKSGPDRVFFEFICGLDITKYDTHIVTTSNKGEYWSLLPDTVTRHIIRRPFRIWQRYPADGLLFKLLKVRPDVVITTLRMNTTANLIYWLLPKSIKLINRITNDLSANSAELIGMGTRQRLATYLNKYLIYKTDAIIVQSHHMAADVKSQVLNCPKIKVLYNPISEKYLSDRVDYLKSALLKGKPTLVSVGRLMPQKGYDVLLPAMVKVHKYFPDVRLSIFGTGQEYEPLEKLISQLRLQSVVTLEGFNKNPLPFVKCADLFVLPSRYEGFSNATLEALALGTPVVVTDSPGANKELIINGRNGYLCSINNSDDLADKICMALTLKWDKCLITKSTFDRFASDKILYELSVLIDEVVKK